MVARRAVHLVRVRVRVRIRVTVRVRVRVRVTVTVTVTVRVTVRVRVTVKPTGIVNSSALPLRGTDYPSDRKVGNLLPACDW